MGRFALLVACAALPLAARHDLSVCGTTRETGREIRFLHDRAVRSRAASLPRTPSLPRATVPPGRDAGEIAIVYDSDGVVARQNQFNLDQNTLLFTPSSGAASYSYSVSALGYDGAAASAGVVLTGLGDDDSRAIDLPFAFPFFGTAYSRVFLNSDGNLTFGEGDISSDLRTLGRTTAGPPRIAPLFDDLDPSSAGSVRVKLETGLAVISWTGVPEWQASGTGDPQTFQVWLYADGRIAFSYSGTNPANAVVGIMPGHLAPATALVDFRTDLSAQYSAAVAERFSNVLSVDVMAVAQKFYQTHDDAYDYLAIYNGMDIPAVSGAVAFETTVRSSGTGYAAAPVDHGEEYGSTSRLHAVLNMGPLSEYPMDPDGPVPLRALTGDTPVTLLGHEAGHLFLAYASVRDPANPAARPMLNTDLQHWSFVFNSDASLLEGERIEDRGEGVQPRFLTTGTVEGYSMLDRYLMGFAEASEVPPSFLVTGAPAYLLGARPQRGVAFDGGRRDVAIDELIAAEGRRTPDSTVAQRRFRFAFLLVMPAGTNPTAAQLAQVDGYRAQFENFFAKATGNRAFADTSLKKRLQFSLSPAAGVIEGGQVTAILTLAAPAPGDVVVSLAAPGGYAAVPESVRFPKGRTVLMFPVAGVRAGVEEIAAIPTAGLGYETAYARVQVAPASILKLEAVSAAGENPVLVRLTDANRLAYAGVRIVAVPAADGAVVPSVAVTGPDGVAEFHWSLGFGPASRLRLSVEAMPAVSLTLQADGAQPAIATVVNAASWSPGIAPGGLATISGSRLGAGQIAWASPPWPAALGGVSVLLNGKPAPLLYVSDQQINFYVPLETPIGTTTIATAAAGLVKATATVTVASAAPGIFDVVQTGARIEIYATGLGTSGAAPTVWIGTTAVSPDSSAPVPGTPGLVRITAPLPAGLAPGTANVVLSVGLARSNAIPLEIR